MVNIETYKFIENKMKNQEQLQKYIEYVIVVIKSNCIDTID